MTTRPRLGLALLLVGGTVGCGTLRDPYRGMTTPAKAGLNTRDLIDPPAQNEADTNYRLADLTAVADRVRTKLAAAAPSHRPRHVLCLSGGGSFGAFSAGLLVGWTATGTRPEFDVVTGISTGALIAPLAFLGPKYDADMARFYTDIRTREVYISKPVRGLLGESLADNSPLADKIDAVLTPQLIGELACEHRKGRRLYVGTTELEGRRFIVWDIGAIAYDGDRELIKQVLLGSSAIPGFFPPSKIAVSVDGRPFVEKHGDGGVSQGIFFRGPYLPPEERTADSAANLAGTTVWCVVAGKLYADPAPLKARSLSAAGASVSTVIYAQTRGDLQRIFTLCTLSGMNYRLTAIPEGFDAPKSAAEFEAEPMTRMYEEGRRLACSGQAWRQTPPGVLEGEKVQTRGGTCLTERRTGARVDTTSPTDGLLSPGPLAIPAVPGSTVK